MGVMSIRIDDQKRKQLKAIASLQDKSMSSIVEGLIDEYIRDFYQNHDRAGELRDIMKVSEPSFGEWDNDEDSVYDDLSASAAKRRF
jgi:sulfur relay (sulfurtransferase) DsrC/TusE family protein